MARLSPGPRLLQLGSLVAVAFSLAACASERSALSETPSTPAQWSGQNSRSETATHRVLRDAAAWAAFWQEVGQPEPAAFAPAREMAVAVFLGERRSGGYTVRIVDAGPRDGRFVVTFRESPPPAGTRVTQALTYPWALAVVPRSDLPVSVVPAAALPLRPAQK